MDSLARRFSRLTTINILSNITVPLVGLVDTAMLGHLPDIRFLAGVALASVLFDYIYWTCASLRMSTTGITAQVWGRGEKRESTVVLYRSLALGLVVGTLVLLAQFPLRELGFGVLTGEAGVEAAGRDYFDARIWGAPAVLANFALVGWFLGREESGHVLVITVVQNLTNVFLNYVFIMRMDLAAEGAGLASALSAYLAVVVAVGIFFLRTSPVSWRLAEVLDGGRLRALLRLNRDILIRTVCLISTFAVFVNLSSIMGTAVLAANSIQLKLLALASNLIDGVAFATESLAGIFQGQGDREGLSRLVRMAVFTGVGFALLFLGGLALSPESVYGIFTNHGELIALCLETGPWLLPVLAFGALAYIYDGLFIGLTAGRVLRNSMVFSIVVFLPVALTAYYLESNHLLWGAMVLFMVARAASLGWVSRRVVAGSFES